MPTKKTRINLTVDDDMNEIFEELSELTGTPKATLIMEFLREAKPALITMKRGLKMAKTSRERVSHAMFDLVAQANEQTAVINREMAEMLSRQTDWVGHD